MASGYSFDTFERHAQSWGAGVAGGPVGRDLHLPVRGPVGNPARTRRPFRRTSRTASARFYLM
jgi:hypothetical protein